MHTNLKLNILASALYTQGPSLIKITLMETLRSSLGAGGVLCLIAVLVLCYSPASGQKIKDKLKLGGKESSLEGKKIKEMTMSSDPAATITPGNNVKIGITVVLDDGKEMKTRGLADGKVKWGNYKVDVIGGSFDDGIVTIKEDPRKIPGYKITVKASPVSDSSISKSIELPLSFKANHYTSFDGRDGEMGKNGEKGESGKSGASDSKGRGANGSNGRDGQRGGNGGRGGDGQAVDVYVTAFKSDAGKTLLKVYAKSRSTKRKVPHR